jgi:hypothetical protein
VKLTASFGIVTLAVAATLSACGGDDDDDGDASTPTETSVAATVAPPEGASPLGDGTRAGSAEPGRPLAAGVYYTELFTPRLVVTLPDGWGNAGQYADQLALLRRPEPGDQALTIDSSPGDDAAATVVELTSVRGTEATPPFEKEVAGLPAQQFDLTIVDEQVRIPALSDVYTSFEGDKIRVWVLDVDGVTLKILAEATGAEFDAFVVEAEAVLETLRFE